ncbi:MAG TPA: site-2 protease family protein [Terriglobales bacterium]|nr:site-2 protease family protein [Terriglobales bacterium]
MSLGSFLTSLGAVAVVLGVMILVHEFGHYAAAKFFGVRVEQFALGFGKRLFGFRKGETDYRVNLLPLGGYVKMSGENPLDTPTGDPREFLSHPRWHRFIIAIAGPAMNILLAIGLLTGIYMVRYEHAAYMDQPAVVGWVQDNSPAQKAGIQAGDRIVRIDNLLNPTWEDALYKILLSPNQPLDIAVERGSQVLTKRVVPEKVGKDEVGDAGLEPEQVINISAVEAGMPAAKAGIEPGDELVSVGDTPIHSAQGLIRRLQDNGAKPIEVRVLREGQERAFTVTPVLDKERGDGAYRIGVLPGSRIHVDKLPFRQALLRSLQENKRNSLLVFELVQKMIQRKVSMRQMSGPIGIAQASGEAVRQKGWTPILTLMAMISLQLGLFNLFPIPILDGGVILLLILEGLMRRDISLTVKERIYKAAFVFLVLFAVLVIYNDLTKAIPALGG